MDDRSDQELIIEFVRNGSEPAFTALVGRHTSLVFGTALRKVGDRSVAEEITQTVFIRLAHKAAFLCQRRNLSGWLHQATILESQHRLRAELRRARREIIAMEMQEPTNESRLIEDVDDALLELSEKDRQPLLLRFFQSLSLRDVGTQLGIREDAAQKRVAKSLLLLERILRRRGRDFHPGAIAVTLGESAQGAPAGLAISAAKAAFASRGASTALGIVFGKFMAMTKLQTAAVCLLAVAAPLLVQTERLQSAQREQQGLESTLRANQSKAARYVEATNKLRRDLEDLEADRKAMTAAAKAKSPSVVAQPKSADAHLYRWSDSSAFVRLPKDILDALRLTALKPIDGVAQSTNGARNRPDRVNPLDSKGTLSPALAEALGLTNEQQKAVADSLRHFAAQFETTAAQHTILTNAVPPGIDFETPKQGQVYTLLTESFPEQGDELRRQLVAELELAIGAERTATLLRQARLMFEFDFLDFGARQRWLAAAPQDDGLIRLGRSQSRDGNWLGGSVFSVSANEVPESLRAHLPVELLTKHE